MNAKLFWLVACVGAYWIYCVVLGLRGRRMVRAASDYFIAGRRTSLWVIVLAATAASFSGWTLIGHPGLILRDGFPYAAVSFYAICIPLTGVLFLKRQWMLGKRFGFVTPGEMLSDYFQGDSIRLLTVLVAVLFSIPYLALQLSAVGLLFNVLTDGALAPEVGMVVLAVAVVLYVLGGGLRAVAYVDGLQCVLLAFGLIVAGVLMVQAIGGWSALVDGMALLARSSGADPWPGGSAVSTLAMPGPIQFTAGLGLEAPAGGPWTGMMVLTFMWAVMGIQAAPAFTMWAFGSTDPKPFAIQQVWASAFGIGLILFVFGTLIGIGAQFGGGSAQVNRDPGLWQFMQDRGSVAPLANWETDHRRIDLATVAGVRQAFGDPVFARLIAEGGIVALAGGGDLAQQRSAGAAVVAAVQAGTAPETAAAGAAFFRLTVPESAGTAPDTLLPHVLNRIGATMPWLLGLLAAAALAALQTTGAAYMSTTGSILTRDLYKRFLAPGASYDAQRRFGRLSVVLLVLAALATALANTDALVLLGGIAVAIGLQMWPSLAAVCYLPFITRQGVVWGLAVGIGAVLLTDSPGVALQQALGLELWGRWPWTIHSAGWGFVANLVVTVAGSILSRDDGAADHRRIFHEFLAEHAAVPPARRRWIAWAWAAALLWTFLAVGPGALIGNSLFGLPNAPDTWWFGIPSIWVWQLLFWGLGVAMIWFLAVRMQMSTVPQDAVDELMEDIGELTPQPGRAP